MLLMEPDAGSPGTAPCAGVMPVSRLPLPLLPCSILALPALPVLPAVPFAQRLPAHRALLAPVPALHGDMGASPRWVASVNRVAHPSSICPRAPGKCPLPALGAAGVSAPLSSSSPPSSSRG